MKNGGIILRQGILMPDGFGFRKKIERTLYDCYGPLGEYHTITPKLPLKNGYYLRLRRVFSYYDRWESVWADMCGTFKYGYIKVD